jgi:hypothetical protein
MFGTVLIIVFGNGTSSSTNKLTTKLRPTTLTDKTSYRLLNEILNAMTEWKVVGGIFCDLQKVFDCVNHNTLLTKIEFYRITGTMLKLIKSYLEGRYQRVILDNYNCNYISLIPAQTGEK